MYTVSTVIERRSWDARYIPMKPISRLSTISPKLMFTSAVMSDARRAVHTAPQVRSKLMRPSSAQRRRASSAMPGNVADDRSSA
jgi:hypothetical protein